MASADPRYDTLAWHRLRLAVLDRDHWLCQVRDVGCTNLRASCRPCNSSRGNRLAQSRSARYRTGLARYATRM
jgi:hypothetical protein